MTYKIGTFVALILISVLGIGYYISISKSVSSVNEDSPIGPAYFPGILTILLIILCIISFFQTVRSEDKKIIIPNFKKIVLTMMLTLLFIISWVVFDAFYINSFFYLTLLFTLFKIHSVRNILINALTALSLVVFLYLIFHVILNISF